ncbi:MAG TPA: zinc metalloprotease HtpX [Chloroflexi bacterium]|nr:zinc metalloprotease HtpX [Chloroflexota bacterium]
MPRSRIPKADASLQLRMLVTMLLLTALYLVFTFVLFKVTHFGLVLFLIPIVGLVVQYYYSDKMVLAASGARIVSREQAPEIYGMIERLAQAAALPTPKVAIIDSAMPNAFATGRSPKHAVVAVTTGLIQKLPPQEVEAVLAHEMTHIRHRDMTIMTMASSFAAVAAFITSWGLWFGIGMGGSDERDNNGGNAFIVILLAALAVQVISHFLILALSRYREYAADRGGAILTGAPEQLASALLRISGSMQSIPSKDLRAAQPLSAMYFAAPTREFIGELLMDHPSIEHRLARLQSIERQMAGAQ